MDAWTAGLEEIEDKDANNVAVGTKIEDGDREVKSEQAQTTGDQTQKVVTRLGI